MPPFNRMRNIYGSTSIPSGGSSFGGGIYDTFLSRVLPKLRAAQRRNRAYQEEQTLGEREFTSGERERDRQFQSGRDRLSEIGKLQAEQNRPMNTVFQHAPGDEPITPYQQAQLALREKEIGLRGETAESKTELDKAKLEETKRRNLSTEQINKQKADIADWRTRNPNMRIQAPKGGFLIGINPQTGESQLIMDKEGNPISTGSMSEEERINLQSDIKGVERREGQVNALERIKTAAEERRRTDATRGQTPSQEQRAILNRAQAELANDPSLEDFVSVENGFLTFAPDTPTNVINKILGGRKDDINLPSDTDSEEPSTERIQVIGPGNKVYTLPANQVDDFLASAEGKGFKRAK